MPAMLAGFFRSAGPARRPPGFLRTLSAATVDQPAVQLRILLAGFAVGGLDDPDQVAAQAQRSRSSDPSLDDPAARPSKARPGRRFSRDSPSSPGTIHRRIVRLYLASALQRLPLKIRWDIAEGLVAHSSDAADHNLPLMDWYGIEPLASLDAWRALKLAAGSPIPLIQEFMARRVGAIGTPESLALLVDELGQAQKSRTRASLLTGIEESLRRPASSRHARGVAGCLSAVECRP